MTRLSFAPLRRIPCTAFLALFAAAVTGCKGTDVPSSGAGDVGGTLVIAIPGDVGTLVPGLVASQADR